MHSDHPVPGNERRRRAASLDHSECGRTQAADTGNGIRCGVLGSNSALNATAAPLYLNAAAAHQHLYPSFTIELVEATALAGGGLWTAKLSTVHALARRREILGRAPSQCCRVALSLRMYVYLCLPSLLPPPRVGTGSPHTFSDFCTGARICVKRAIGSAAVVAAVAAAAAVAAVAEGAAAAAVKVEAETEAAVSGRRLLVVHVRADGQASRMAQSSPRSFKATSSFLLSR